MVLNLFQTTSRHTFYYKKECILIRIIFNFQTSFISFIGDSFSSMLFCFFLIVSVSCDRHDGPVNPDGPDDYGEDIIPNVHNADLVEDYQEGLLILGGGTQVGWMCTEHKSMIGSV